MNTRSGWRWRWPSRRSSCYTAVDCFRDSSRCTACSTGRCATARCRTTLSRPWPRTIRCSTLRTPANSSPDDNFDDDDSKMLQYWSRKVALPRPPAEWRISAACEHPLPRFVYLFIYSSFHVRKDKHDFRREAQLRNLKRIKQLCGLNGQHRAVPLTCSPNCAEYARCDTVLFPRYDTIRYEMLF